ncbi:hypothetical protein J2797_005597 [Paraburkholderia terricola]|uniref:hypothetical protein n=1 Tax=Paraburkholderia terricola TaxID=169427 RepID=UPI0028676775|nr:hypothetical protein [Paraburkholderia terricola]MDR6495673.1 hypothetical protein [Paraburkholderia terricola]
MSFGLNASNRCAPRGRAIKCVVTTRSSSKPPRAQFENPALHRGNVTAVFVLVLGEPLSGPVLERLEHSQAAGTMIVSKSRHTSKNARSSIVVKPLDDCTLPRVVPTVSIPHSPELAEYPDLGKLISWTGDIEQLETGKDKHADLGPFHRVYPNALEDGRL